MCFIGAIAINGYVKFEVPLIYYESKVCKGRRRKEPTHYDYMLAEPKLFSEIEPNQN